MKRYTEIQSSLLVATPSHNGNAIFCSDFTGRNSITDKGSGDILHS
jgi:hypothetical protein